MADSPLEDADSIPVWEVATKVPDGDIRELCSDENAGPVVFGMLGEVTWELEICVAVL